MAKTIFSFSKIKKSWPVGGIKVVVMSGLMRIFNVRKGKQEQSGGGLPSACVLCVPCSCWETSHVEMHSSCAKWKVMLGDRWGSEVLRKFKWNWGHKVARKNTGWFLPEFRSSGNRKAVRVRTRRDHLEHHSCTPRWMLQKGWVFQEKWKRTWDHSLTHFLKIIVYLYIH